MCRHNCSASLGVHVYRRLTEHEALSRVHDEGAAVAVLGIIKARMVGLQLCSTLKALHKGGTAVRKVPVHLCPCPAHLRRMRTFFEKLSMWEMWLGKYGTARAPRGGPLRVRVVWLAQTR